MKYRVFKISVASVFFAVAAAVGITLGADRVAQAQGENSVELTPLTSGSQINYHYFDDPVSVFADSFGVMIADETAVKTASFEGAISGVRNVRADKAARHVDYTVTLENGVLHSYYGDVEQTYSAFGDFKDFDIEGDTLFAITDDRLAVVPLGDETFDSQNAKSVAFASDIYEKIIPSSIAVCNGKVYVSVRSAVFGNKSDVCAVDLQTGALDTVLVQSDAILSMTAMDYSEVLYTLTRDKITGYSSSGGGLTAKYSARDAQTTDIYAYDGYVYTLTSLNSLRKYPADLGVSATLAASASDDTGFFNMPSDVTVKNSAMYVTDTVNDRIAVYSDAVTYMNGTYTAPSAVACDSSGTVYIANEYNKIDVVSGNTVLSLTVGGVIKQLAVDSDKNLFISATDGLWLSRNKTSPKLISTVKYKAIALGASRHALYAIDGTAVKKLELADDDTLNETTVCTADDGQFAIAADISENIYLLSRNGITRFSPDDNGGGKTLFAFTEADKPYSLGYTSGQIELCTIQNGFVNYGDVIIVDTYKHRLFTVSGKALGVSLIDDDYDIPDLPSDNTPPLFAPRLIRTALTDVKVFSMPMETPSVYTIAKDRKVIVPEYSVADAREYALVLIDDIANGKLVQGYVYKDLLSEPLPYEAPPVETGTVFTNATPIYKYPSPNAPTVRGYEATDKNTGFELLDFVKSYRDDYNNLWYRIALSNKTEGYILASNLSLLNYEPVFIRPAYNAEIISFRDSDKARAYTLTDDEYVALDVELPVGTKVEVVGAFDSSKYYTLVKYLDPELGTLQCYVETAHIKYNGVNIVLLVAVIVIIITVILAALIIGRVFYVKKRRLISNGDTD